MTSVLAATATELAEFQPIRGGLLILGRHVVSTLAIATLKHNVIAWHISTLTFVSPNGVEHLICNQRVGVQLPSPANVSCSTSSD